MYKWILGIDIDLTDDLAVGAGLYTENLLSDGKDWGIWLEVHLLFIHIVLGKAPAEFADMGIE